MAEVITMPRLSDTMKEGKVSKWHKSVGDTVKEGDVLAEIETDKAVQDFECEFNGKLLYIGTQEGEQAAVDSILAIVGNEGEDISGLLTPTASTQEKEVQAEAQDKTAAPQEIPSDIHIITMPRLSDTMTEGKVAKWNKNVGDAVKEGEVIAEIETDKAVQDFESEFIGTLLYQGVSEGNATKVDEVLAIIGPAGTDVSAFVSSSAVNTQSAAVQKVENTAPQAQNNSHQLPANNQKQSDSRINISPLARKMAQEKGIDIYTVQGSGDHGRIVKKDIENYTPSATHQSKPSATTPSAQVAMSFVQGETTETLNSQVRNIIASRLSESKFTAPHYYLMVEIDMDRAIEARKEINTLSESKISFNDIVIKATSLALRKHQQVNSSWAGDKIIHHGNINIGVAVAIEDGLVVPVLKNADQMSFGQISGSVKDLASRAKSKGLKANEMEGSTFSISNLGMFGIETFTSIINQPNSCILSVGAIVEKPVVKNGQVVVGNTMKLSLACDHRVVDGATGAQFLQSLREYLENPLAMLL
ncbi:MAG: 2-oxo acid dehydrogenase subunit E2 [Cloacibacterium sp.]|nr:2-oxo acid dehydrogenase subunit E2 [Cloacibacterium sp.]